MFTRLLIMKPLATDLSVLAEVLCWTSPHKSYDYRC